MATNTIDPTILQMLTALTERVERLEQALSAKNDTYDPVVATYERDDITFEVTQREADAMRKRLGKRSKPRSDDLIHEMVLIDKMTAYSRQNYSREESIAKFTNAIDVIRAEAIANGTAIDEAWEVAIDD